MQKTLQDSIEYNSKHMSKYTVKLCFIQKLKVNYKRRVKTPFKAMLNEYNIEYAAMQYKTQ